MIHLVAVEFGDGVRHLYLRHCCHLHVNRPAIRRATIKVTTPGGKMEGPFTGPATGAFHQAAKAACQVAGTAGYEQLGR
jgi:hypothetical protein